MNFATDVVEEILIVDWMKTFPYSVKKLLNSPLTWEYPYRGVVRPGARCIVQIPMYLRWAVFWSYCFLCVSRTSIYLKWEKVSLTIERSLDSQIFLHQIMKLIFQVFKWWQSSIKSSSIISNPLTVITQLKMWRRGLQRMNKSSKRCMKQQRLSKYSHTTPDIHNL